MDTGYFLLNSKYSVEDHDTMVTADSTGSKLRNFVADVNDKHHVTV